MVDLIHQNYLIIHVLDRFGISLGFGDKTIHELCKEKKLNTDFFLEIINSYLDPDYFPKETLKTFPVRMIIEYLSKTHQEYLGNLIPRIETLIGEIAKSCYTDKKHGFLLSKFFNEYREELIKHIEREDNKVFPYAQCVELVYQNKADKHCLSIISRYSIATYQNEHDDIEEKLYDLKNIIIKYLPAPKKPTLCIDVLQELFHLEKDMNDHSRIEEKVLIPMVERMEKEISGRK